MNIEICETAGAFSLYVNGVRIVDRESFALVDRVRDALEHPERHDFSEAGDVARSIRDWLEQVAS